MSNVQSEIKNHCKPILFSTRMVQAILHDKKTVTRRAIKNNPEHDLVGMRENNIAIFRGYGPITYDITCPYSVDDILYVRETWYKDGIYLYKAGYELADSEYRKWKPSIFMPKEAARIFLKITDIKVEHIQDISDEEAKAEGANFDINGPGYNVGVSEKLSRSPVQRFRELWDDTVTRGKYIWDNNPYVWVIHFERLHNVTFYNGEVITNERINM